MEELRAQINEVDAEIVGLFRRRMDIVSKIAAYKIANGLPVYDPAREEALLKRLSALAGEGLEADVRELYAAILEISKRRQSVMMKAPL